MTQHTPVEWLSAYLDGQVSADERPQRSREEVAHRPGQHEERNRHQRKLVHPTGNLNHQGLER